MPLPLTDRLPGWQHVEDLLERSLALPQASFDRPHFATLLAELVQQAVPEALWAVCRLGTGPDAVLATAGPESEARQAELVSWAMLVDPKQMPVIDPVLAPAGSTVYIETLRGSPGGFLALTSKQTHDEGRCDAQLLLSLLALTAQLVLRMVGEHAPHTPGSDEAELRQQTRTLTHEFNNYLNTLVLQLAILEQEVADPLRSELAELRRRGREMGQMVQQFQRQLKSQRSADPG